MSRRKSPGERAAEEAARQRAHRNEVLASLPSVRNPTVNIYVPREPDRAPARTPKTRAAQQRQGGAIRDRARSERLEAVGRARKDQLMGELDYGPNAERLQQTMDDDEQDRFRAASARLARIPNQALGILFNYEGGQGDYNSVVERLLGSPESRDVDEGLDKLEALAELGEKAAIMYAPRNVGRLRL